MEIIGNMENIGNMEPTAQQQEAMAWEALKREMMDSYNLNFAFRDLKGDKAIRTRRGKVRWLAEHVAPEKLEGYFDFQHVRVCSHCGKPMSWGYLIEGGTTYCSDECLHQHISAEEFEELYDEGRGDSYYTTWIE